MCGDAGRQAGPADGNTLMLCTRTKRQNLMCSSLVLILAFFFQISTWYKQYCCSFLLPGALLEQLCRLCCSYLHSWLFWGDVAQREGLPCMALRHHHGITTSSHSLMEKWIYAMTDPTFVWKKSKRLEVISAQYPAFSTPADWCKASWETMYCCPMLFGGCNGKGVLLDVTFWSRIDRCNGNGKNWR